MENEKFRGVALEEPRKCLPGFFFNDASRLVKHLAPNDLAPTTKVGIQPQLIDIDTFEMVMDFVIERKDNAVHILNSISPAFTNSMYFGELVVKNHTLTQKN